MRNYPTSFEMGLATVDGDHEQCEATCVNFRHQLRLPAFARFGDTKRWTTDTQLIPRFDAVALDEKEVTHVAIRLFCLSAENKSACMRALDMRLGMNNTFPT